MNEYKLYRGNYYRLRVIRGVINEIDYKKNFISIAQDKMYHLDRNNCYMETWLQFDSMQKDDDIVIKYIRIKQKDNYMNIIISNHKHTFVDSITEWLVAKIL